MRAFSAKLLIHSVYQARIQLAETGGIVPKVEPVLKQTLVS
jgi:hypothetical protein